MENFEFEVPVHLYFGNDSLDKLVPALTQAISARGGAGISTESTLGALDHGVRGKTSVLLVYGGESLKKSGAYDEICARLDAAGIAHVDLGGNRSARLSAGIAGIDLCRSRGIDAVIGIGGGSCMDMAKIIAFGVRNENMWDYLSLGKSPVGLSHLAIGEIATYPSSGSEMDSSAEVDDDVKGHGSLYGIYPDFAICCPRLSYTLSARDTAYGSLATFIQITSRYFSEGSSPIAEAAAESLMRSIIQNLPKALAAPRDEAARSGLMLASALGVSGICGIAKPGEWTIYALEDVVEMNSDIRYVESICVVFPKFLRWAAASGHPLLIQYAANVWGVSPNVPDAIALGVERTEEFFADCGIARSYRDVGVRLTGEKLRSLVDERDEEDCLFGRVTHDAMFEILKNCL
jgi:alcohol dehydrogenase YqhD (iron-dependent ADH family)